MTPCMDVYKAKIQSDGSIDKLKLIIVVRGDLQNKDLIGDTYSPTASMKTLNNSWQILLITRQECSSYIFFGAFLQAKVKNTVFVKLDSRYADCFLEYSSYFGRDLRLLKSMYGMTNYGNLFAY